jgi:hypothetical protein
VNSDTNKIYRTISIDPLKKVNTLITAISVIFIISLFFQSAYSQSAFKINSNLSGINNTPLSQHPEITITISSNKNEYLRLEPVWINIKFKNTGEETDSMEINEDLDLVRNLVIKNSYDQTLPFINMPGEYIPTYVKIRPDEELNYYVEITESFGKLIKHSILRSYLTEDSYSIQSIYKTASATSYSNTIY